MCFFLINTSENTSFSRKKIPRPADLLALGFSFLAYIHTGNKGTFWLQRLCPQYCSASGKTSWFKVCCESHCRSITALHIAACLCCHHWQEELPSFPGEWVAIPGSQVLVSGLCPPEMCCSPPDCAGPSWTGASISSGSEQLVSHEWSIKNSSPQFQTVKWQAARFHTLGFYLRWDLREKYKFAGKVKNI